MNITNRVFITGRSALCSTGSTAESIWNALLTGQSGIDEIKNWDVSALPYKLGGELKDFQAAKSLPDRKLMKVISQQDAMGIYAATQAVENSQIVAYQQTLDEQALTYFNEQTGVYVGSPGNKYFQQYDFLPLIAKTKGNMQAFAEQLFENVHPMWLLRILPNNVLAYAGITYGFKGPNHNVTNHAVSGTQALLEGYNAIASGQAERVVVVAYDIGTEPQALYYYDKLGVLSSRHLKPFDKDRDGTILAEGAAAVVLESEASAKARKATCYGEVLGGLTATECKGLFSVEREGQHLSQLIQESLNKSNINQEDIAFVVAHGNGNKKSEDSEADAISQVFGENSVPVTSFKWSMGHTLGVSGILDTVLSTYALQEKQVPGIANLEEIAPHCRQLNVSTETVKLTKGQAAMIINRGFASMNACLVIKNAS